MKQFPYTQFEIEKSVDDLIPGGEKKQLAELMGVSDGLMSSWLNPDDDRKSPFFQTLKFFFAADKRGFGDQFFRLFVTYRGTWNQNAKELLDSDSIAQSTKKLMDRLGDLVKGQLGEDSVNEQIVDAQNLIEEASRLKQSLIQKRNVAHTTPRTITRKDFH